MNKYAQLIGRIRQIVSATAPPSPKELQEDLERGCTALETEDPDRRPRDEADRPGGLVNLREDLPLVVVPDIHGRIGFLLTILSTSFPEHGIDRPLLEAIEAEQAQLLMVGDYVHGEMRARIRWFHAFEEYTTGFRQHEAIDEEMRENLSVLQIVANLKAHYPDRVCGLKGNHENITNEDRDGNIPFGKFVNEGAMVAEYMARFYAGAPYEAVYRFEKSLPLLAVGPRALVSHGEPARFFSPLELIEYRSRAEVVIGFTWTDNDAAETGSVQRMLQHYLPHLTPEEAIYIGGHRPVSGRFALRADGRYVQIHNPGKFIAALPPADRAFDPKRDVKELRKDESILG